MKEWIYGRRPVAEHLKILPKTCERLLVAAGAKLPPEIAEAAAGAGLAPETVAREKLDGLAAGGNHQGVCLRVSGWEYKDVDDLVEIARSGRGLDLLFVLDCVQDPRNLGAVLRVADGVGAAGVVIPKDRAAGLTAAAARSSAGAAAAVGVAQVVNLARTLRELKAEGFAVVGAAQGSGLSLFEARLDFPLAVVLGAEGEGLRPNVAAQCDALLSLPMRGVVGSLNVSVAAGVFGYESLRRRGR